MFDEINDFPYRISKMVTRLTSVMSCLYITQDEASSSGSAFSLVQRSLKTRHESRSPEDAFSENAKAQGGTGSRRYRFQGVGQNPAPYM
eukprot:SAG22_NODE_110_length_19679_cov_45.046527_11_plen_89_part_00